MLEGGRARHDLPGHVVFKLCSCQLLAGRTVLIFPSQGSTERYAPVRPALHNLGRGKTCIGNDGRPGGGTGCLVGATPYLPILDQHRPPHSRQPQHQGPTTCVSGKIPCSVVRGRALGEQHALARCAILIVGFNLSPFPLLHPCLCMPFFAVSRVVKAVRGCGSVVLRDVS